MDTLDTHAWLADHGDYLFRMARRQLHSDELAEDAVQETLLAAISAQARYAGSASPRTWLTGILKHKIVDQIRRSVREVELPRDADGEEAVDSLFRQDGHWAETVRPWGNPHAEAELSQLRRVLDDCADRLKPVMAQGWRRCSACARWPGWKPKKSVRNWVSRRRTAGYCCIGRVCSCGNAWS